MTSRALLVSAIASGQGKTTVDRGARAPSMRTRHAACACSRRAPISSMPSCSSAPPGMRCMCSTCGWWARTSAGGCSTRQRSGRPRAHRGRHGTLRRHALLRGSRPPIRSARAGGHRRERHGADRRRRAAGLRDFGPVRLAGVIANGVASEGHAAMVSAALRDVPLVASLAAASGIAPRASSRTRAARGQRGHRGAARIPRPLDQNRRARVGRRRAASRRRAPAPDIGAAAAGRCVRRRPSRRRPVAIARDAAFAFLYPANVDCLESLGARVCFFSPLAGDPVPPGAAAVFLPGGYPELHAEQLSAAHRFHDSIRAAHAGRDSDSRRMRRHDDARAIARRYARPRTGRWPAYSPATPHAAAARGARAASVGHGVRRIARPHVPLLDSRDAARGLDANLALIRAARAARPSIVVGSLHGFVLPRVFPSCPRRSRALLQGSRRDGPRRHGLRNDERRGQELSRDRARALVRASRSEGRARSRRRT